MKRKHRRLLAATNKDIPAAQLSPMAMLVVLMVKHMGRGGRITEEHLEDLIGQAIAHYGSVEGAIAALETGRMKLERVR